jgi:hypothetical protein
LKGIEMEIVERATFLPNPHVKREPCVPECMKCKKIYSDLPLGECSIEDHVCIAYRDPSAIHRKGGCYLHSNKKVEVVDKKKINPIKQSKRLRRKK